MAAIGMGRRRGWPGRLRLGARPRGRRQDTPGCRGRPRVTRGQCRRALRAVRPRPPGRPGTGRPGAGERRRFDRPARPGRAVMLVLDDLHLADAEALEFVADLAGWCRAERLLVVGVFRNDGPVPAEGDRAGATGDGSRLVLGP